MKREKRQQLDVEKRAAMMGAGEQISRASPPTPVLPDVGLSKWSQIQPFIPLCRESWRKLVLAGKAPQPIRLSPACTVYRNEDVHRWLADPLNYRQEAA